MFKRLLLLFCFLGGFLTIQAQNRVEQVMEIFMEDYNTSNYDQFYHRFSESLQSRVPFNTVEAFFDEMKQNLGSIINIEYYGLNDDQTPLFKTQFEKDTAIVNFAFDEESNIVGFRILDYVNQDDLRQGLIEKSLEDIILDNANHLPEQGEIALAIIKGDQVHYYGLKKKSKLIRDVDNKRGLFALGTFTSIFTNTILAQADVEGKVKLWEDINAYYPQPFKDTLSFSFSSLANGSAMLPFFPKITLVGEDLVTNKKKRKEQETSIGNPSIANYLAQDIELDTLKVRGRFSIFGSSVLGDALARVYHKPYTDLFKTHIVDQYNLPSTQLIKSRRTKTVESIGKVDLGLDNKASYMDIFLPSTQGYSTIEDLSTYIQAYFDPKNKELALMQKPTYMITPDDWISLGWRLNFFGDKESLYFHRGIDVAYSNFVSFSPERKEGVIVLANSSMDDMVQLVENLSFQIWSKLVLEDKE
ncbi:MULTISPECIES: beta-lactamase family protein [unclassified Myroides]|uniref:beta-lactamase family protein n=1 Tax=unclassified Myroides TaxID=2642485 RepID=UPI0025758BB0|nr:MULTISPECIES: beta-lactamase family protein [unclassified Myroides]